MATGGVSISKVCPGATRIRNFVKKHEKTVAGYNMIKYGHM
jgi:hypothetical protein